ncbi:TNFAIP3-interacting protein 1-like [Anabas testudineus]|uniref:TNFAIP3 interacting protein 1 n=1 Tax=Anabas testudineus TaxID=64144 RepID=A0A7N6BAH4_ANATE|nr:TNFAIP3-interacting protein 1-like [Anabas testudineus]
MWTTTQTDNMNENMTDRPQATATVPADSIKKYRLYPSLPNVDRYDAYIPKCEVEQKLQTAVEFRPDALLENAQSEVTAASCDVKMKAQMLILEEQRQELLSINEKWAREYRTMVQYYKEKVRELKSLIQHNHSDFEDEILEEGDIHVAFHKKLQFNKDEERRRTRDGDNSSQLLKAKEEAKELRVQNNTLTRRGQYQHEEIKRLNKALEDALRTPQPLDCSETLQDLWKHQAEVYKEDFLKERKDREKLKEKYLDLKKKFIKVHNECCAFKSQAQPVHECSCTNRAKCSNWEVRPVNQHHTQLHRHCAVDNKP